MRPQFANVLATGIFLAALPVAITGVGEAQSTPSAQGYTLNVGTPVRITLNNELNTNKAVQGDPFTAAVAAPVFSADGSMLLIPKGSTVVGKVASVQKSGTMSGESQLQLSFQRLHLPDGTSMPLRAEVSQVNTKGGVGKVVTGAPSTTSEGGVQSSQSRRTVGSAAAGGVAGAAIGAIAGGGKGAGIGTLVGAGLGVLTATRGGNLDLPSGTELTIVLDDPLRFPAK